MGITTSRTFGVYQPSWFDQSIISTLLKHNKCRATFSEEPETTDTSFFETHNTVILPSNTPVPIFRKALQKCNKIILFGIPILATEDAKVLFGHIAESNVELAIMPSYEYLLLTDLSRNIRAIQHLTIERTACYGSLHYGKLVRQLADDLFFVVSTTKNRIIKTKIQTQHNNQQDLMVCNVFFEMEDGCTGALLYNQVDTKTHSSISLFSAEKTYKISDGETVNVLTQRDQTIETEDLRTGKTEEDLGKMLINKLDSLIDKDLSMSKSLRFLQETHKALSVIKQNKLNQTS